MNRCLRNRPRSWRSRRGCRWWCEYTWRPGRQSQRWYRLLGQNIRLRPHGRLSRCKRSQSGHAARRSAFPNRWRRVRLSWPGSQVDPSTRHSKPWRLLWDPPGSWCKPKPLSRCHALSSKPPWWWLNPHPGPRCTCRLHLLLFSAVPWILPLKQPWTGPEARQRTSLQQEIVLWCCSVGWFRCLMPTMRNRALQSMLLLPELINWRHVSSGALPSPYSCCIPR